MMSKHFDIKGSSEHSTFLFSIIICSYNPDERIFRRCLEAVRLLNGSAGTFEVLLIDNNSIPELYSFEYIREAVAQMPFMRIIVEKQQGLSFARQRGFLESKGRYLIFFDDDNEPFSDYLMALSRLYDTFPSVGAWGPGNVWVDYVDGIASELKEYADLLFQERHEAFVQYASQRSQQNCYPYGTGLSIKRELMQYYVALLSEGGLTLKGRDGNLLTSGEDTQMVLACIVQGAAAGVAPDLKIKHMVPGKRATYAYIKKLIYGTHVCYDLSIRQLIPEHVVNFGRPLKGNSMLWFKVVKRYLKVKISGNVGKEFRFIEWMGLMTSSYLAEGKKVPAIIDSTIKRLL